MNNVVLCGRLYKDVELKQGQNGKSIARTGIAVQRDYKNSEGKYDSDFLSVIAFGGTADFLSKYFNKGTKIILSGKIQTGSFTNKEGQKVYTTDIVATNVEFAESKGASSGSNKTQGLKPADDGGFMNIPDGIDEELPFN